MNIFEIRAREIAVDEVGEFVLMFEQIFRHVGIAVDAVVDLGGAVVRVETLADALQDLGRVAEVGLVEFGVGEGGDLVDHVFEVGEARAAVPPRVEDVGVGCAHAEVFGSDRVGTIEEGGLGVDPLLFAEGPLKAVSVVDRSQTKAAGERAVAQGFDHLRTRDFVDVGYHDHVALLDLLLSRQRREDLIHHGVAGEPLPCPCIAQRLAGHVENVVDDLVVEGGKARPVVFDV